MRWSCVRLRPGDQASDRPTIVHGCLSRPRRSVSPERPLSGVPITAPASGDRPGFLRRRHRSGKPFHSCGGNRWSLHDQKPFDIDRNAFMAERQDCESLFGLDRVDEQRPSLPDVGLDQFPDLLSHPRGKVPDVHTPADTSSIHRVRAPRSPAGAADRTMTTTGDPLPRRPPWRRRDWSLQRRSCVDSPTERRR